MVSSFVVILRIWNCFETVQCGVAESVKTSAKVKRAYEDMDTYLKFWEENEFKSNEMGIVYHVLFFWNKEPQSSTRVCKILLSPKRSSWSNQIQHQAKQYASILTEGKEVAKNALEKFVFEKNYNIESNILDAIINLLAKITSCIIRVHYQCGDGSFFHHAVPPMNPLCQTSHALNLLLLMHIMILSVTLRRQRSLPHQLWSWTSG